jgi:CheY-like chemotaxis protein
MIVAPQAVEASLLARRLMRWGARVAVAPNETVAQALLPEREWSAVLIDHAIGGDAIASLLAGARNVPCRLIMLTPQARHALDELRAHGFTGYLVKPIRAASLAARLQVDADGFARLPNGVERARAQGRDRAGLSILVAEDNDINALLARALLQKLGHRPVVAVNGHAALESFLAAQSAGAPFDLILMDVRMAGLDGLEATRRIRTAETAGGRRRTPIVALTANAFAEDRDACLAAGMDGFLAKPLDRDKLDAILAAFATPPPAAHAA